MRRRNTSGSFAGMLVAAAIVLGAVCLLGPTAIRARVFFFIGPNPASSAPAGAPSVSAKAFDEAEARRTYPGDKAPKSDIAQWMGTWAQRAALPPELPVMAALVESNLTNHQVMYDHDSLGYFQMRKSYFAGRYPEYWKHPERQMRWFIDTALRVKSDRLKKGQRAFLTDPRQWGEWCADIERPATRYRHRYQLRLEEARRLLA